MGAESHLVVSLLAALRGQWNKINWSGTKAECRKYRDGSDEHPGSDNHPVLAWLTALVVAWKRPDLLPRLGLKIGEVVLWWRRELETRLREGLQLVEVRARIYAIWNAVLICWLWRAFREFQDLMYLHKSYVRATAAQVALCAYPVKAKRLDPRAYDNPVDVPIFIPLAGARSHEQTGDKTHHKLTSAWDYFAAELLGLNWKRGGGSQTEWARDIVAAARPGWMGLSDREVSIFRTAIETGNPPMVNSLMSWLDGVGTLWGCFLVRFERGSACIGYGRAVTVSTAPVYTMAVHADGTVEYLVMDGGGRGGDNIDREPCGVDLQRNSPRVTAWAGGEDLPVKRLPFHKDRWGEPVWIVKLARNGQHEVLWPREATPEPPGPGPEPPTPPRDDDRDWYDYPGLWLTKLWWWLEGRF